MDNLISIEAQCFNVPESEFLYYSLPLPLLMLRNFTTDCNYFCLPAIRELKELVFIFYPN